MAAPFLIGVAAFWAGPMLYSLYLVTQDWNMMSPSRWAGLGNFQRLFDDELVGVSLWNTAYYTFLGVPMRLALAFLLAIGLNQRIRGRGVFRTVFYLPSITPAVASAVIWVQLLNPDFGVVNNVLGLVGIPPIAWLTNPPYAKPAFILMSLWGVGPQMVIFLAALQNLPSELIEAAQIDGANAWQRFLNITVPLISSVTLFNFTMGIIGSFQVFASSFVMTRGGPQNATLFVVLYIYDTAFTFYRMGYAAVLSWFLFAIIMLVTLIQLRITDRWVYYEFS
jgi:multiple sugar transport system permease protein